MRFTSRPATSPTNTPEASRSRERLQSSAVVAIDLEPLANELRHCTEPVREVLDRQHELSHAVERLSECTRQRAIGSAEQLQGIVERLGRLDEFNTAFQRSLQQFETAQQRLSEQYIRDVSEATRQEDAERLAPIEQVAGDDPFASSSLFSELEGVLDDFGIALILPNESDPFDAQTMKPKTGTHRCQLASAVVANVCEPGAAYGDYVLAHALVEVGEQSPTTDLLMEKELCSLSGPEANAESASKREPVSRI